ncbi:MAG: MCE family protein [Desulfobulbaceae bacterium]|nr:MCE family protein [Desulfobulbaceae bacterium]
MKRDKINYFGVGLFVMGMFVVLMLTLLKLTGRDADSVSYLVQYKSIAGIREGSSVTLSGYKIGQVASIIPMPKSDIGGYQLELSVRGDWKIPGDSTASIVSPGLLSEKQVNITPGGSAAYLSPGGSIKGVEKVNVMAAIENMANQMNELTEDSIKPLIASIGDSVTSLSADLHNDLPQVITNLNTLIENLNSSATSLSHMISPQNTEHVNSFFANADSIAKDLSGLTDDISSLRSQLELFVGEAHQVVKENRVNIERTVSGLADQTDVLGLHLNTTLYHLDETSRNLSELSRALRENPALLIRGTKKENGGEEK